MVILPQFVPGVIFQHWPLAASVISPAQAQTYLNKHRRRWLARLNQALDFWRVVRGIQLEWVIGRVNSANYRVAGSTLWPSGKVVFWPGGDGVGRGLDREGSERG